MAGLSELFDGFANAYARSLYAIEKEQARLEERKRIQRRTVIDQYSHQRSQLTENAVLRQRQLLQKLEKVSTAMENSPDTVVRAAEYLSYGRIIPRSEPNSPADRSRIPCILPFLGRGNILLDSQGTERQKVGLEFVLQALRQTAPGQLSVTVYNPMLRSEFYALNPLPGFRWLRRNPGSMVFWKKLAEPL